jgi:hypothetical protein
MATSQQKFQQFLDHMVPKRALRWFMVLMLMTLFALRIYIAQGYYIVTYGLGIFLLNLFISFLSPQTDPEFDYEGPALPTRSDDEFRPFIRKLPEFKFWYSICKAIIIAMLLTTSRAFDVPVYWPILLFYFIILFVMTMKRRIQHMITHKYVPISKSKPKVQPRNPEGKEFERSK